jgi:hypothetical protein
MPEKLEGTTPPQEGKEKSMHEKAMGGILKRAEETSKDGKTTFEDAFLSLLESDGYSGGMYPALEEALKKQNIPELVRVAHMDGWL